MANVVNENMYNQLVKLYWWDTAKADKYKASIENTYSTDKYNELVNNLNKLYWSSSSTPTTTTTKTNTVSQASNWISQASLDVNRNNAKAWTWYVAPMPEKSTLTAQDEVAKNVAQKWSWLDYDTQQKKLQTVAWLKDYLDSKWIFSKTAPEQPTTTTQTTTPTKTTTKTTPQQQQWDYQDNSQARKDQILDHLNNYRVTNPELFEDASMFYNFFIDWNGRSQEQIDLLWDYFNRVQKYGKYDNLPASSIWDMLVNGKLPEDYLNYLKSTDPQKYQEALSYKQDAEDAIKYEDYLSSIASMAWIEVNEPSSIQYWKYNEIWMDEDNNWIDDRREHYATEEEQWYQKQIADLNAANLEIDNIVKHTYDDLVKAYPWATKATLMAMAQDKNADLLREKENNLVELTRLQGYVWYMQAERQEMNKAGADSIAQLQKNLWMYYQYSPEWLSELAQAQYGATNITLDQAETWTDTQKQMALDSVLTDYFDKYGSIIQRSKNQVINDVMAYATKNWVTLAEALQENFVKQLQQKPEFKTISSWWSLTADKWAKLNDDTLYNVTTWEIMSTKGWTSTYSTMSTSSITPISASANEETTASLMTKYPIWSSYKNWECWELMNLDASSSGSNIHFWSELSDKTKWINRETYEWPKVWTYVVFDWSEKPWASAKMQQCWHVGKVVWMWDWYIDVWNQNWTKSWKVTVDRYNLKDYEKYIAWYVDPTQTADYWYWGSPMDEWFAAIRNSWKLNAKQSEALDFSDAAYTIMYDLAKNWDIDYFLRSPDWQKVLSNYAAAQFSNNASYTEDQILNALKNWVTDQRILRIVNDLMTVIEKKLRWTSWAAISWSEWNSNSKMLIPQAWENYNTQFRKFQTFEWEYLKKPFESSRQYAWVDSQYVPLFDWKSIYYTKYIPNAEQESDEVI